MGRNASKNIVDRGVTRQKTSGLLEIQSMSTRARFASASSMDSAPGCVSVRGFEGHIAAFFGWAGTCCQTFHGTYGFHFHLTGAGSVRKLLKF